MIDYDSFLRCHLTDIHFSRGSKRVKYVVNGSQFKLNRGMWALKQQSLLTICRSSTSQGGTNFLCNVDQIRSWNVLCK